MSGGNDPLAYGHYYGGKDDGQAEGERGLGDSARGFLSDGLQKLKSQYSSHSTGQQGYSSQSQSQSQSGAPAAGQPQPYQSGSYQQQPQPSQSAAPYGHHSPYQNTTQNPNTAYSTQNRPSRQGLSSLLDRFEETVSDVGSQLAQKIGTTIDADAYAGYGPTNANANNNNSGGSNTRFNSFAPPRGNNDVKWHVDGFSYFWAVSRALETASDSIWILDCKFLFRNFSQPSIFKTLTG